MPLTSASDRDMPEMAAIHAQGLTVGDILVLNDWNLHVIGVACDQPVTVLTAEFDFPIHIPRGAVVKIQTSREAA